MGYLLAFTVAVGLLAVAAVLVVLQRRLTTAQRAGVVLVTFAGGIVTNFLLTYRDAASFRISLQQTLDWTYSALTMFAGGGSVSVIEGLVTPAGVPVTVVQLARYFFQVFAFLFT